MAKKGKAAGEPKTGKPSRAERAEAKRQKRIAGLEEQLDTARELNAAVGALVAAIEEELLAVRAAAPVMLVPEPAPAPLAPRRAPRRPRPVPPTGA
jgi:hypothetical protein